MERKKGSNQCGCFPFLVDSSVKVVGDASPRDSHGGNRLCLELTVSLQPARISDTGSFDKFPKTGRSNSTDRQKFYFPDAIAFRASACERRMIPSAAHPAGIFGRDSADSASRKPDLSSVLMTENRITTSDLGRQLLPVSTLSFRFPRCILIEKLGLRWAFF